MANSLSAAGVSTAWLESCDPREQSAMQKLLNTTMYLQALGVGASPSFVGATLSGLSPNLTVGTGTGGQLETIQNLRPAASPTFTGLTLSGFSGNVGDNVVVGTGGLLETQSAGNGIVRSLMMEINAHTVISETTCQFVPMTNGYGHDSTGGWWVIGQPTRITVDSDGLYLISYSSEILGTGVSPNNWMEMYVRVNGDPINQLLKAASLAFVTGMRISGGGVLGLSAGDYIELFSNEQSGNPSIGGGDEDVISVTKLGVLA